MHLQIWCIGRLENIVLLTLRVMYRSAPLRHSCCGSSALPAFLDLCCAPGARAHRMDGALAG
jgi:hypothetical protein